MWFFAEGAETTETKKEETEKTEEAEVKDAEKKEVCNNYFITRCNILLIDLQFVKLQLIMY